MKRVSIRELHTRTGHYVRAAARQPIAATDQGETIAVIQPATCDQVRARPFPKRNRDRLPLVGADSTAAISEDRDR